MKPHILILAGIAFLLTACKTADQGQTNTNSNNEKEVLTTLMEKYEQGEILRCSFEGKTIYKCSRNAYDAGSEIYDEKGEKIGVCYYSTGTVDPPCEQAQECEAVYRVFPNIWGKPKVGG